MARRLTSDLARSDLYTAAAVGFAACVALGLAHGPWREATVAWLSQEVPVRVGGWGETLPLRVWTRDGLMTLFFFGLGLELKSEMARGELSSLRRSALPVAAALGGIAAATAVYAPLAGPAGTAGWSTWPAVLGTDITLVLAAISLSPRVAPVALRSFALAIALTDNVVLVLVLALRGAAGVDAEPLAAAAAALTFLALLSRWRAAPLALFGAVVLALWAATLRAGLDPSVAGVAAALMTPMRPRRVGERGMVERIRSALRPVLHHGVTPVFVFCAVGPRLATPEPTTASWFSAALLAGALVGKGLGAVLACALAARLGWARRPSGLSWRDVFAAALASALGLTSGAYALSAAATPAPDLEWASAAVLGTSLVLFAAVLWIRSHSGARPAPASDPPTGRAS